MVVALVEVWEKSAPQVAMKNHFFFLFGGLPPAVWSTGWRIFLNNF
jgi:hypothetical protein